MDSSRLITIYGFYSSILANRRKIFIYLPPSYHTNEQQRYPVLYMQDGQHMFFADRKEIHGMFTERPIGSPVKAG